MISAILLAAGFSRRMGRFKQLLPFGGKTFVECCVDNLAASTVDDIIVVTGHNREAVESVLSGRQLRLIYNADYSLGMASSIKAGMRAVPEATSGVLIALVDQPQIGSEIFDIVISAYKAHRPFIVVPAYLGKGGHPIIVDSSLREEIAKMDTESGLRRVLYTNESRTLRIEIDNPAILKDFDYPDDL